MKPKFLAIVSVAEDWDGKPTPNVTVSTEAYDTVEKLNHAVGSLIHRYTNPDKYIVDAVSYLSNSVDVKYIEPPVPEHHAFPIKVTVHAELVILTKDGLIHPMSWYDSLKKRGDI